MKQPYQPPQRAEIEGEQEGDFRFAHAKDEAKIDFAAWISNAVYTAQAAALQEDSEAKYIIAVDNLEGVMVDYLGKEYDAEVKAKKEELMREHLDDKDAGTLVINELARWKFRKLMQLLKDKQQEFAELGIGSGAELG